MDIWTVAIGLGSIVVPSIVAILVYRRQAPKRELWWDYIYDSITPDAPTSLTGRLSVNIDGVPVEDPYLIRLRFWSTGKADVQSSAFDQGKPIAFVVDAPILGEYEAPVIGGLDTAAVSVDGQRVLIAPTLLRQDCAIAVRLIVSGRPIVMEESSIVDVRLRRMPRGGVAPRASLRRALIGAAAIIVAGLGVLLVLFPPGGEKDVAEAWPVGSIMMWVIVTVVGAGWLSVIVDVVRMALNINGPVARARDRYWKQLRRAEGQHLDEAVSEGSGRE